MVCYEKRDVINMASVESTQDHCNIVSVPKENQSCFIFVKYYCGIKVYVCTCTHARAHVRHTLSIGT